MDYGKHTKVIEYFSKYPLRKYQKGQILLHFDEELDYIYFIESGRVRKYTISDNGTEIVVNIFHKNSLFPVSLALLESNTAYIYEAMSVINIRRAPVDDFMTFFKNYPELILDKLKEVHSIADRNLVRMTLMVSASAYTRILYELVNECSYYKPKIDGNYYIPMHEYEIAECAGLTRETASREFKKLIDKKIVKVTRKKIIIKNLKKLKTELENNR